MIARSRSSPAFRGIAARSCLTRSAPTRAIAMRSCLTCIAVRIIEECRAEGALAWWNGEDGRWKDGANPDSTLTMDHTDHTNLLRRGIDGSGGVWADLGAGSGAFTLALAELLGPDGAIDAIDRDARALRVNAESMRARFPHVRVRYQVADFTQPLAVPLLDGIVMANSLHFQSDQEAVVRQLRGYLRPGGRLLIVEYNVEHANFAVPHPVSYSRLERLAQDAGFEQTALLARRPSRFLNEIYSAVSR